MTHRRLLTPLLLAALAGAGSLRGQDAGVPSVRPTARFDLAERGQPGTRPGTEYWIATTRRHTYDLSAARAAIRAGTRDAAAGRALIARYERMVVAEQAALTTKVEALGGRIVRRWWLIHGCLMELPRTALEGVASLPDIATFEPSVTARKSGLRTVPPIDIATNASHHNADAVQASGERGAGALVSIMDGSFDVNYQGTGSPHQIFYRNAVKTAANLLLPPANIHQVGSQAVNIPNEHGTAVASVAAGSGWSGASNSEGHAPDAPKVVYSIADQGNGDSLAATMASAWQQMATHKLTNLHDIKVANNSYSGSPNPTNAVQQALDALAHDFDVLITTSAGNDGLNPQPAQHSQSTANGLAVGSCYAFSKTMDPDSSFGPLPGTANVNRTWPDITGVGGSVRMAKFGDETSSLQQGGTSFAAPQVAGAAALVRSVNPSLSALETKAILLASTEDIATQNPTLGVDNYGQGFLRDDLAVDIARRAATNVATGFHTVGGAALPDWFIPMEVTAGSTYSVVCAWNRTAPYNATNWCDFRTSVVQYEPTFQTLVSSASSRNLYRKLTFTSTVTGRVWIVVTALAVQHTGVNNEFAVAHTGDSLEGTVVDFGQGCAGTGPVAGSTVLPAASAAAMGNSRSIWPWTAATPGAGADLTVQQLLLGTEQTAAVSYTGVSFRQDDSVANPPGGRVEVRIRMGYTNKSVSTMSSTFLSNFTGAIRTVLPRQWITLPSIPAAANGNPAQFFLTIPFDTPFQYVPTPGENVLIEFTLYSDERRDSGTTTANPGEPKRRFWTDFVTGANTANVRGSTAAGVGIVTAGAGSVLRLEHVSGSGGAPRLSHIGWPGNGRPFTFHGEQCAAGSGVFFVVGLSNTTSQGQPLPLDLSSLGAPGCVVLTSDETSTFVPTDATGRARLVWNIPVSPFSVGLRVFAQIASLDAAANQLGLTMSQALDLQIGAVGIRW